MIYTRTVENCCTIGDNGKWGACMAKTETQVTIRVTSNFKERLEMQAQRERRSVASMVRIVMADYLERKEKEAEL